jgi:hypothetical protein
MKTMKLLVLVAVTLALASSAALANGPGNRHVARYPVSYQTWDGAMYNHWHFRESCRSDYAYGWSNTCYDHSYFRPDTTIYIEERWDDYDGYGGYYHWVTVHRDDRFTDPYVTYYVYDNGTEYRVIRREYYHDNYYVMDPAAALVYVSVALPMDAAYLESKGDYRAAEWERIASAVELGSIAAIVAAGSNGDEATLVAAGASAISASISAVKAYQDAKKATEMERYLAEQEKLKKQDGADVTPQPIK